MMRMFQVHDQHPITEAGTPASKRRMGKRRRCLSCVSRRGVRLVSFAPILKHGKLEIEVLLAIDVVEGRTDGHRGARG